MFKKTMTFEDLEGNDVTETFYFNYNKKDIAELLEFGRILEFEPEPGFVYEPLEDVLKRLSTSREESGLSNTENNRMAYLRFQTLILDAFGKKGANNVNFDKTPELRHYFKTHVAFPEMIFEFLGNEALAGEFIEKCLPPKLVARVKEEQAKNPVSSEDIAEMVAEADRRQQDPATRIEPGLENAPAHIQEHAQTLTTSAQAAAKKPEDLTADDVLVLSDEDFKKLDPRRLSQPAMVAAFQRKSSG